MCCRRHTSCCYCSKLLISVLPLACSEAGSKPASEKSTGPGWHEVRLLRRTGVINDFQPVRPEKPVEYPTEYAINGGDAHVRFARSRATDGPDLEIEGASNRFADEILAMLRARGLSAAR
jgi:hypothetical protein